VGGAIREAAQPSTEDAARFDGTTASHAGPACEEALEFCVREWAKSGAIGASNVTSQWQYQVRFDVTDSAIAEAVRRSVRDPVLAPLFDILVAHRAAPKCQFDAFAEYVAAAEEHGIENYPLYAWTKTTIEDPAKKEKYLKSFTLHVDEREVYAKEIADALEADLQPLAVTGLISRISKYDTNPADNPQPPQPTIERS
jgi:hypothetical protein